MATTPSTGTSGSSDNSALYAALIQAALASSQAAAKSQGDDEDRKANAAKAIADAYQNQQTQTMARDQGYMNTFGMDPVKQQKDLYRASALAALAQHGPAQYGQGGHGQSLNGNPDFSGAASQFLSNPALANGAANFYQAAGALSPDAPTPNLSNIGFGQDGANLQGYLNDSVGNARANRKDLVDQQFNALGNNYNQAVEDENKPGIWRKIGGYASLIGGYALAPYTGGLSIPAGQAGFAWGQGGGAGDAAQAAGMSYLGGKLGGTGGGSQGLDYFNRNAASLKLGQGGV